MDISNEHDFLGASAGDLGRKTKSRAKSSLRLKYEAETQVISRKLGSLEAIREKLGLSQRKMAQLLLVDPSAWTRWTKGAEQAPPHIYRMLQWYLALEEKYPALDVNFWLKTVAQIPEKIESSSVELAKLRADMDARLAQLEAAFSAREAALRKRIFGLAAIATLVGGLIGFIAARALW